MSTTATRVRATTGDGLRVTRRRARQDAGLLVGVLVLLTATLVAMLAAPRFLDRAAELALREAVAQAGAQVVVTVPGVFDSFSSPDPPLDAALREARWLDQSLDATHAATAAVPSRPFVAQVDGLEFLTRLVTLEVPADPGEPVRWTAGREPVALERPAVDPSQAPRGDTADDAGGVPATDAVPAAEVGLSVTAARTLGIDPTAGPVPVRLGPGRAAPVVHITGLYEALDPDDVRWATVTDLLGAVPAPPTADVTRSAALYVPASTRDDLWLVPGALLGGQAVAVVDADSLTVSLAHDLRREVRTLASATPDVTSGLPEVVDAFDAHADATRAQASLVLAGVGATAACCLVLAGVLVVERRRTFLATERARGASLASVALRGALESVPSAVVAVLVAGAVVAAWLDGRLGTPWPGGAPGTVWQPVAVAVVAAVAPAVLAARAAGAAWTGRRVPADRRERARLAGLRRARRLMVEAVAVAAAVAALVSLRGRGLVPSGSSSADPFLTSTPFLLAVAASLVVVHVAPAVVRAAGRWASRSRGLAAPLAVTRAQRAASALLPLVAVTVAVALMVLSGVLVQNVRDGQLLAADRLVGADVRLDGALSTPEATAALEALAAAEGVDVVATGAQIDDRAYGRGTGLTATVLVVDSAALAEVRAARGLPVDPGLTGLADASGDRVPALVSADLLARVDTTDGGHLQVLADHVGIDVRGATTLTSDAGAPPVDARAAHAAVTADDGVVVVDGAVLAAAADRAPAPTRAWVAGPGAAQAVDDLGLADLPGVTVTTVDGWWHAWTRAPLPTALTTLLLAAVGMLAALAVVALALVVVATSGERGQTLSTLRTLGLDARTARWATLGELAPLVVGGLVGGTTIGLALPLLIGDALGLAWVTAAPGDVPVTLTWWPVLLAAAALVVALCVAVAVEQAVRRRERLGDVLRVGAR